VSTEDDAPPFATVGPDAPDVDGCRQISLQDGDVLVYGPGDDEWVQSDLHVTLGMMV
jgi:hypothetical protein